MFEPDKIEEQAVAWKHILENLVRKWRKDHYEYINIYLDIEDLVQIAFESILKSAKTYIPDYPSWPYSTSFRSYATNRAFYAVFDEGRRARGVRHYKEYKHYLMWTPHTTTPDTCYQNIVFNEYIKELDNLDDRLVYVLKRRYDEFATLKEIGVELNVGESRVCQLVSDALGKIGVKEDCRYENLQA